MPAKNESFLVLEDSLKEEIETAVAAAIAIFLAKINKLVEAGEFEEARKEVDSLSLDSIIKKQEKFMTLISVQALLFGARDFKEANNTVFAGQPIPEEILKAVNTAGIIMLRNMETATKKIAERKIIEEEDTRLVSEPTPKEEFRQELSTAVNNNNNAYIGIAASALVSRSASFGFTSQALAENQVFYEVSEILDSRTCPICRVMDGKVFPVMVAHNQLQFMMNMDDPDDLSGAFPWPSQNSDSVRRIQNLSQEQLINSGLALPPYHGNCLVAGTKVYTREGFLDFKDIPVGAEFLSLNPKTLSLEWVPSVANQAYFYEGEVYHYTQAHGAVNLKVTPDHSQFVLRRVDRGSLGRNLEGTFIPADTAFDSPENWMYHSSENPIETVETIDLGFAEYPAKPFIKVLAWYLSGGHTRKRKDHYESYIFQQSHIEGIAKDIDDCGILFTTTEDKFYISSKNKGLPEWLYPFGQSHEKYIPDFVFSLSSELQSLFLDSYVLGDGHTKVSDCFGYPSTNRMISTTSTRMRDQLVELCIRSGISSSYFLMSKAGTVVTHYNGDYASNHDCWGISLRSRLRSKPTVNVEHYKGMVYDVTLNRNHTLLVSYEGRVCWTGNCRGVVVRTTANPDNIIPDSDSFLSLF